VAIQHWRRLSRTTKLLNGWRQAFVAEAFVLAVKLEIADYSLERSSRLSFGVSWGLDRLDELPPKCGRILSPVRPRAFLG
jgi:hypothetical protein